MKLLHKSHLTYIDTFLSHAKGDFSKSYDIHADGKIISYRPWSKRLWVSKPNCFRNTTNIYEHSTGIVNSLTQANTKFWDKKRKAPARALATYQGFHESFKLPKGYAQNLFGNSIAVPVVTHILSTYIPKAPTTMLDICAGIGGFHIAAKQVFPNIECIGFYEIKKPAIRCYQKNFPTTPLLGDLTLEKAPLCDLLCAGFPCQPFSCINKLTHGENHKNYDMIDHIVNKIKESQCKYFVLENVAAFAKSPHFDRVKHIPSYHIQHTILNACDFGLKQSRNRVYIIGIRRSGSDKTKCTRRRSRK